MARSAAAYDLLKNLTAARFLPVAPSGAHAPTIDDKRWLILPSPPLSYPACGEDSGAEWLSVSAVGVPSWGVYETRRFAIFPRFIFPGVMNERFHRELPAAGFPEESGHLRRGLFLLREHPTTYSAERKDCFHGARSAAHSFLRQPAGRACHLRDLRCPLTTGRPGNAVGCSDIRYRYTENPLI